MNNDLELWALHWIGGYIDGKRRLEARHIEQIRSHIHWVYQERQRLLKEEKENGETNV